MFFLQSEEASLLKFDDDEVPLDGQWSSDEDDQFDEEDFDVDVESSGEESEQKEKTKKKQLVSWTFFIGGLQRLLPVL